MAINNNKQKGDKLRADEWNELALETNNLKGKVNNPSYLNSKVFPTYNSVEEASGQITNLSQAGDTVRILQSDGSVILYWLQPDEEQHLEYVLKESGGGSSSDIIGPDGTAIEPDSKNEINYTAFTNKSAVIDETTEEVKSLGYKILDGSKPLSEQLEDDNTIYEVRDEFDLKGNDITISSNSKFEFNGGRIVDSIGTGKILGIDKLVVKPRDFGCVAGEDSNLADNNSVQLKKLTNIDTVVIELDDNYTFGSSNIPEFNNLVIHGNGHFIYGAASVIFRINKDLTVKDLCYDTLANNPTLFYMIGDNTSNVSIDNMKIDNGIVSPVDASEMTSIRVIYSDKQCQFKTETPVKTFNTTEHFEENDYVLYNKNIFRCKNENGHEGAYVAKDFVYCRASLHNYTNDYDATIDYAESTAFTKTIDGTKRYFYFLSAKEAGEWSDDLITNNVVQEVEEVEIDKSKKLNLSVTNSIFKNIWNNSGSHIIFLMQNTLFDYMEFKNNLIENMGDCFCDAGVTNSSVWNKIIEHGYNYKRVPRHIEFTNNKIHNEATFKPWDLILGSFEEFSEEKSYSSGNKVKYTSVEGVSPYAETLTKVYKFSASKEAGAWDATKVKVSIPRAYFTPLLVEYGDCIYTNNTITNLINYHYVYENTYDGYLSVNDIVQENNISRNVYNLEGLQTIVKSKRGSLSTHKRVYRNNVWLEEPLSSINPELEKYWTRTHIIGDYKGYHQTITNNVITIQKYDPLSYNTNYLTVFKLNNNIITIKELWITCARDGNDRNQPAFTGLYPKYQEYVEIIGNTITVEKNKDTASVASSSSNVETDRVVPLVHPYNSVDIKNIVIKDNKLTNLELIKDVYSKNGVVQDNIVIGEGVSNNFLFGANRCDIKFTNNEYEGCFFPTPAVLGSDVFSLTPFYNNKEFDVWYTPVSTTNYGFIISYPNNESIYKCIELKIEDVENVVYTYKFIGNKEATYYINTNGAFAFISQKDSASNRSGVLATISKFPIGINGFRISTGPRIRIVFTDEAILNKYKYHISVKTTNVLNKGILLDAKRGPTSRRYYATEAGQFYYDTTIEKLIYWDGECWKSVTSDEMVINNEYEDETMLTSLEDRCGLTASNGFQFIQDGVEEVDSNHSNTVYTNYISYRILQGNYAIANTSSGKIVDGGTNNNFKYFILPLNGVKKVRFTGPKSTSRGYGIFKGLPYVGQTISNASFLSWHSYDSAYQTTDRVITSYISEYYLIAGTDFDNSNSDDIADINFLMAICDTNIGSMYIDVFELYITPTTGEEYRLPIIDESKTLLKDTDKWKYKGDVQIDDYCLNSIAVSKYQSDTYKGIQVYMTDLGYVGIWSGTTWVRPDSGAITRAVTPIFTYTDNIITNITSTTANSSIYYTLDNSTPTKESTLFSPYTYTPLSEPVEYQASTYWKLEEDTYVLVQDEEAPDDWEENFDNYYKREATTIVLNDGDTIKAVAIANDMMNSNIAEYTYEQE